MYSYFKVIFANLFYSLYRFADRSYVYNSRPSQICPCESLHSWWHCRCEHHRLSVLVLESEVLEHGEVLGQVIVGLLFSHRHVIQNLHKINN